MQRAMPTTVAAWLGSFADAFADAVPLVEAAQRLVDQNPLGSRRAQAESPRMCAVGLNAAAEEWTVAYLFTASATVVVF